MTHIVGLRLTNFVRFRGTHTLELDRGTYAIVAAAERDPERSNWLGKSTLVSAIRYALEGYKPKVYPSLDSMISHGEPEMQVDVELSDGTFVSRKKPRGKPTDLEVNTPDGMTVARVLYKDPAERFIWEQLGLSASDLESTAYAAQRKLAWLVQAEDGADLNALANGWLDLGKLEVAADRAGADLRALTKQLREAEAQLVEARQALEGLDRKELQARYEQLCKDAVDETKAIERYKQQSYRREEWVALKTRHDHVHGLRLDVSRRERELAELPRPKGDVDILRIQHEKALRAFHAADDEWNRKRRLAVGQFDGACPVNGDACPVKDKINAGRERNGQLLAEAKAERDSKAVTRNAVTHAYDDACAAQRAIERASDSLADARRRLAEAERGLPLLGPEPPEPEPVVSAAALQLSQVRERILTCDRASNRELELTVAVDKYRKQVAAARAAFAVLGPEGAQRRVSERAMQVIEAAANRDLSEAGVDLSVALRWGRETQKPAEQCPQCGAAFPKSASAKTCEGCLAPRGLKVVPDLRFQLSNVSAAAEDLAGLAVRCAAFKWLRARRGAQWSVAVLDEPFSALDRAHVRALSAHVQRLLDGTFDQAFVIAHDAQVLDSMPRRIQITGDGKWSSAKVVG